MQKQCYFFHNAVDQEPTITNQNNGCSIDYPFYFLLSFYWDMQNIITYSWLQHCHILCHA
jgi:hypothetical protein